MIDTSKHTVVLPVADYNALMKVEGLTDLVKINLSEPSMRPLLDALITIQNRIPGPNISIDELINRTEMYVKITK